MRRRLLGIPVFIALGVAALVGPMGTAAVPPYVYACTPGASSGGAAFVAIYLYNGQATTANVTFRILSANGTNLTVGLGLAAAQTVAPTTTKILVYTQPSGINNSFAWDPQNASTIPAAIRVVSDVALQVGGNFTSGGDHLTSCGLIIV